MTASSPAARSRLAREQHQRLCAELMRRVEATLLVRPSTEALRNAIERARQILHRAVILVNRAQKEGRTCPTCGNVAPLMLTEFDGDKPAYVFRCQEHGEFRRKV